MKLNLYWVLVGLPGFARDFIVSSVSMSLYLSVSPLYLSVSPLYFSVSPLYLSASASPLYLSISIYLYLSVSPLYLSCLSLCFSVSSLYLCISTKPNLTLNMPTCWPARLPLSLLPPPSLTPSLSYPLPLSFQVSNSLLLRLIFGGTNSFIIQM